MYGSCQRSAGMTPRYAVAASLMIAWISARSPGSQRLIIGRFYSVSETLSSSAGCHQHFAINRHLPASHCPVKYFAVDLMHHQFWGADHERLDAKGAKRGAPADHVRRRAGH